MLPDPFNAQIWTNPEEITFVFPQCVEDESYFNVSCEQNNLTPIHRDVIMKRLKEIK